MHKITDYLFTLNQALEKNYMSILFNILPRISPALPKYPSKLPEKLGIWCMYKRGYVYFRRPYTLNGMLHISMGYIAHVHLGNSPMTTSGNGT